MRVVLASSNPIETLHKIRNGEYSIITFLDTLEMLDVRSALEEYETKRLARRDS